MEERLRRILCEVLRISPELITDSLGPGDIKAWNSLGHLSLATALEEEFGITFADGDLTEMESVARIRELLRVRGVQG